ncbi:MAG: 2-amino-4-hydroxy-6-hydroxymethyldihydropteridine diphosphokinase [Bacteroidetes bacterium]|nr:2-amino-4-hydroxy-6-hydroxymethyldihydropteridine diphosphokinase [Bacteroidota bacterium]
MKVTLITGANLGEAKKNIVSVKKLIEKEIGSIYNMSNIYTSEAWGFESNDIFYNQVLICETDLSPEDILHKIWSIEKLFGRKRGTENEELNKKNKIESGELNYSSRCMDIDILFYENKIIETKLLTIPHKLIEARSFVLEPLNEIMGTYIHPRLNKSINTLLKELI